MMNLFPALSEEDELFFLYIHFLALLHTHICIYSIWCCASFAYVIAVKSDVNKTIYFTHTFLDMFFWIYRLINGSYLFIQHS